MAETSESLEVTDVTGLQRQGPDKRSARAPCCRGAASGGDENGNREEAAPAAPVSEARDRSEQGRFRDVE